VATLDGRTLIVSAGNDTTVRVWDVDAGASHCKPLRGHEGSVFSVAVGTVDRRSVIVSSGPQAVRVWDLASGMPMGEPLRGHKGSVLSVTLGTLGGRPVIVLGGLDTTVRVWDARGGVVSSVFVGSNVTAVSVAGPGTVAVAATRGVLLLKSET
jgi:WD40 repeat protein